jgi:glycosyltransferase involved in cell wall biosynthesis
MAHVVLVGAFPESALNFRGDLTRTLVAAGHRVTAMSAPATDEQIARIEALGAEHLAYPIVRNSLNPLDDLRTLFALRRIFRKMRPDVVLAYAHKPVIWTGISLIGLSSVRCYTMITGLGFIFHGEGLRRKILMRVIEKLFRLSLWRADGVIFHNPDNRKMFIARGLATAEKSHVVMGSGVNLDHYSPVPVPKSGHTFLMLARLKRDKGVREYLKAAEVIKEKYPDTVFQLVGPEDTSPDGVSAKEVRAWQDKGIVEYHLETRDVRPFIAKCGVYVLPSYSEGLPRSVLEAMAMGRPIITTDTPGCRETVVEGLNGFLVPKAAVTPLVERLEWMINNRDKWQKMGNESLKIAREKFDVHKVNKDMLRLMDL